MATVTVSFLYLFPYIACSREAVKQRSRRNVPPPLQDDDDDEDDFGRRAEEGGEKN